MKNKHLKFSTCICFLLLFACLSVKSQVFWSENFNTGAGWTLNVVTGAEGADPNYFLIADGEGGGITPDLGEPVSCGIANNGNNTLHVTSVFNPTGGAAYDAGGLCGLLYCPQADRRTESPTINCTGHSTITLHYHYIENGDGTTDNATVWYFDGAVWAQIADPAKTFTGTTSCPGQGLWASVNIALPVSANNNPNVKIAFRWVNNDDGIGSDPSFAVDDIELSTPSAGSPPVAAFSASDSTLCVGNCINFTDLTTNTPTSWNWTFPNGTPGTSIIQNPTGICFNVAGTYTITLIATNTNGSDTATLPITVTAIPVITVNPNPVTLCSGDSVVLIASGGTTYTWSPATGLSSTTGSIVTAEPTSTTTYSVTGTTGGCTGSTTVVITVSSGIVAEAGNDTSICSGASVTLNATGGSTYQWNSSPTLSCTNCQSPIASPTTTTTYTVTVSSGTCTPDIDSVTVTVTAGVSLTITPNATTICAGASDTISVSGATTYSWSPATGLNTTTGDTVIANPTTTTTYTVTGTTGGCTGTTTIEVTVTSGIVANAGNDTSVCLGSSVTLNASGGSTYQWNSSPTLSCTNCQSPVATPTTTTTYTVTVSSGTCAPGTDQVTVTVSLPPNANITGDTAVCSGQSTTLTATGGSTYLWSTSETTSSITVYPTVGMNYSVTVSNGGICTDVATIYINVYPPPSVTAFSDTTITIGATAQLSATGAVTYAWAPSNELSCSSCQNPTASPTSTTVYTVTGTDANGCTNSSSVVVTVLMDCGEIFIPKAFSPNGDGYNDILYVRGNCIKYMEFSVYDRWGERVYFGNDPQLGWDGKYKGKKMNSAVFVYYLIATLYDNTEIKKQGNISLIR